MKKLTKTKFVVQIDSLRGIKITAIDESHRQQYQS